MTRIIKHTKIRPRNDFIENKQLTIETTTRDNIMVTKFENIYNKQVDTLNKNYSNGMHCVLTGVYF